MSQRTPRKPNPAKTIFGWLLIAWGVVGIGTFGLRLATGDSSMHGAQEIMGNVAALAMLAGMIVGGVALLRSR